MSRIEPRRTEPMILAHLLRDPEYASIVLAKVRPEHFDDNGERRIYASIQEHHREYGRIPTVDELHHRHSECRMDQRGFIDGSEVLADLRDELKASAPMDSGYVLRETDKWANRQNRNNYILKMVESIETGEGVWPTADEHFQAAHFRLTSAVGLSLFDDFAHQIALLEPPIPFRLPTLNRLTGGGVARKTLNLLVAPTSGGKSMSLCHLAADYVRAGLNVLYATLELSQEMIALRVAANLLQLGMEEIKRTPLGELNRRLIHLRPAMGDMRAVFSPAFSTHVGDIYSVMNQMKAAGKPVDVLIVDYLNRCGVQGIRKGIQVGSYQIAGTIATELHALAGQTNTIVWTATQTNREGYGKKSLELSDTSESYMVNSAADLIIGITKPTEVPNRLILKVMKNRNGAVPEKGAMVAVDYSRMSLMELDAVEDDVGEAMQKARKAIFTTATAGRTRLVT